jgi:hypothetical protein
MQILPLRSAQAQDDEDLHFLGWAKGPRKPSRKSVILSEAKNLHCPGAHRNCRSFPFAPLRVRMTPAFVFMGGPQTHDHSMTYSEFVHTFARLFIQMREAPWSSEYNCTHLTAQSSERFCSCRDSLQPARARAAASDNRRSLSRAPPSGPTSQGQGVAGAASSF